MRIEFQKPALNAMGVNKTNELGDAFSILLDTVQSLVPAGREQSLVITKLQEACFFAKRGIALHKENQA